MSNQMHFTIEQAQQMVDRARADERERCIKDMCEICSGKMTNFSHDVERIANGWAHIEKSIYKPMKLLCGGWEIRERVYQDGLKEEP